MSNRSYCRFENTSGDLSDCIDAVQEALENGKSLDQFVAGLSSEHERRAFQRFRDQCQEYIDAFDELEQNEAVEEEAEDDEKAA